MKWKTYKAGDRQVVIGRAWIPVDCSDGFTRWLEKVVYTYVFKHEYDYDRGMYCVRQLERVDPI